MVAASLYSTRLLRKAVERVERFSHIDVSHLSWCGARTSGNPLEAAIRTLSPHRKAQKRHRTGEYETMRCSTLTTLYVPVQNSARSWLCPQSHGEKLWDPIRTEPSAQTQSVLPLPRGPGRLFVSLLVAGTHRARRRAMVSNVPNFLTLSQSLRCILIAKSRLTRASHCPTWTEVDGADSPSVNQGKPTGARVVRGTII